MKILCLHGAYGSAKNFRTQLEPFVAKLESPGKLEFVFVDGQYDATPPKGFGDYFGKGQLYRNIDHDGVKSLDSLMDALRTTSDGESYEDTLRSLISGGGIENGYNRLMQTMDHVKKIIDEDPDIQGILGYSEGATTASSYLFLEAQRAKESGVPSRLKFGIFFAGWPPSKFEDGQVRHILADESEDVLELPTCHIVGSKDPYLYGAMALYGVCEEDMATLFDHGKGHTVPRDDTTIRELADSIRKTIRTAGCEVY